MNKYLSRASCQGLLTTQQQTNHLGNLLPREFLGNSLPRGAVEDTSEIVGICAVVREDVVVELLFFLKAKDGGARER
jgi:hypothetical protein